MYCRKCKSGKSSPFLLLRMKRQLMFPPAFSAFFVWITPETHSLLGRFGGRDRDGKRGTPVILLLLPALTGGLTKTGAFVSVASPQDKEDIFTLGHGLLLFSH